MRPAVADIGAHSGGHTSHLVGRAAKVADVAPAHEWLHGEEKCVSQRVRDATSLAVLNERWRFSTACQCQRVLVTGLTDGC